MKANFHISKTPYTAEKPAKFSALNVDSSTFASFGHKYHNFWAGVDASMLVHKSRAKDHSRADAAKALKEADMPKPLIPIFLPDDERKIVWDVFLALLIIYTILVTPYNVFFQVTLTTTDMLIEHIIEAFFLFDICLTFNTAIIAYGKDDVFVQDRLLIAKDYARNWLFIDLLSSLPLADIALEFTAHSRTLFSLHLFQVLRLLRLLKLGRVLKLKRLGQHFDNLNINPAIMNLFALVLQVVFIAHLVSCFWYFLASNGWATSDYVNGYYQRTKIDGEVTWLTATGLDTADVQDQYIASIYWTFSTMLSVGYGDISPTTWQERIFAIICMLSGGILFGAVIAQMARLIEMRNPQERNFKLRMGELKAYLAEKCVPPDLQLQAQEAYSYFLQRKSPFSGHGSIMLSLPDKLLMELARHVFHTEINCIDLFRGGPPEFVLKLIMNSKHRLVRRGEIIFEFGDVSDEVIFILEGLVRVSSKVKNQEIISGYATSGGYFGDFEYLSKCTRLAQYTAGTRCRLISLSYRALSEAMFEHTEAGDKFKAAMEERLKVFHSTQKLGFKPYDSATSVGTALKSMKFFKKDASQSFKVSPSTKGGAKSGKGSSASSKVPPAASMKGLQSMMSFRGSVHENSFSGRNGVKSNFAFLSMNDYEDEGILVRDKFWVDGNLRDPSSMAHDLNSLSTVNPADDHCNVLKYRDNLRLEDKPVAPSTNNTQSLINLSSIPLVIVESQISKIGEMYLLHPKGSMKQNWDFFIGMLIVISCLYIPVQVGFNVTNDPIIDLLNYSFDAFFFVDMLLSFRTLYYSRTDDAYVAIPYYITKNYLLHWFVIDMLSCIPFDTILVLASQGSSSSFISVSLLKVARLTRLLKLVRVLKLNEYIQQFEKHMGVSPMVFDLFMTTTKVVLISHFVACFWWGICLAITTNTWFNNEYMVGQDLENATLGQKYLISLYMVVTTLTTTGYGDLIPINSSERIVMVFMMIIGATIFGYVIANVSSIMGNLNLSQVHMRERLTEVTEFLGERDCPTYLSTSIVRHFRYSLARESAFDEKSILEDLPSRLSNEICLCIHAEAMKNIPIFKHIPNAMVSLYIFKQLVPVHLEPGQVVITQNGFPSDVYFLVSGSAVAYKTIKVKPKVEFARYMVEKGRSPSNPQRESNQENNSTSNVALIGRISRRMSSGISKYSVPHEKGDHKLFIHDITPGEFVGLSAITSRSKHRATIEATTASTFYVLRNQELNQILNDQPAVALALQLALGEAAHVQNQNLSQSHAKLSRGLFLKDIKQRFYNLTKPKRRSMSQVVNANSSVLRLLSRRKLKKSQQSETSERQSVSMASISHSNGKNAVDSKLRSRLAQLQKFGSGRSFGDSDSHKAPSETDSVSSKLERRFGKLTLALSSLIWQRKENDTAIQFVGKPTREQLRRQKLDKVLNGNTILYNSENDDETGNELDQPVLAKQRSFKKSKLKRLSKTLMALSTKIHPAIFESKNHSHEVPVRPLHESLSSKLSQKTPFIQTPAAEFTHFDRTHAYGRKEPMVRRQSFPSKDNDMWKAVLRCDVHV